MLKKVDLSVLSDSELNDYIYICESNISKFNNNQLAKKVLLNSLYGALGAPYFRFYNIKNAEAVTLSGQLSIRWIANRINVFLNKMLKTTDEDYVIAIDTDSNYIELKKLVESAFPADANQEKVVDALDKFCKNIMEPQIAKEYEDLADYVNAYENKMVMEREVICSRGFWTGKKRYALNVWDSEGVRYEKPKLKYMGLSAKSSATNSLCRPKLVEMYHLLIESDNSAVIKFIEDFRAEWHTLSSDDIAIPKGINGVLKYGDINGFPIKGSPKHVKAALAHNRMIKDLGLATIEPISDGDKIRYCELKQPNPIGSAVIGFKNHLPDEFKLDAYIDRDEMFEKAFMKPVKTTLDPLGWNHKEEATLEGLFS